MKKAPADGAVDVAGNGAILGAANGTSSKTKEPPPYNVIAIGSQDCCISVWTTGSPRPVFIGKHFFQQSVVDLSWFVPHLTAAYFCCLDHACKLLQSRGGRS